MCLDELRSDIAIKQKKGLPFICTSIIIWLLILIVILLDLPQNTENLLVLCCSCPLLPISWAIGKILKVDIFDKSNPLGNVGFLFTCNQFLYLLIVPSIDKGRHGFSGLKPHLTSFSSLAG